MKILMTGATGLIGSELGQSLIDLGHSLLVVTRNREKALEDLCFSADILEWDLTKKPLESQHFADVEVIINLAGESIDGRWTESKKQKILNSRVLASENLLKNCPQSVRLIMASSAVGFYGDRGNEKLTEASAPGQGFLAEICQKWEEVYLRRSQQHRVVVLRLGMVLSKKGGALKKLVSLFQQNLGAVLGTGEQWMSFMALADVVSLFNTAMSDERYEGVINAVTPYPVTNSEFTQHLVAHLKCLQLPKVPSFVLKIVLGEMSDLVLFSNKVIPQRLLDLDFTFQHIDLKEFFAKELEIATDKYCLFYAEQFIPHEPNVVFDFFSNHANLEKITPTILSFQTERISTPRVQKDTIIDYTLKIRGFPIKWRTWIEVWDQPYNFIDTQLKGPYSFWRHQHTFKAVKGGTLMADEVRYKVPLGALGLTVAGRFVEKDVVGIFNFRRQVIAKLDFDQQDI